jgi:hypothetical protein
MRRHQLRFAVVYREACKLGRKGIVSTDWVKLKNPKRQAVTREAEEDWGRR